MFFCQKRHVLLSKEHVLLSKDMCFCQDMQHYIPLPSPLGEGLGVSLLCFCSFHLHHSALVIHERHHPSLVGIDVIGQL